jgi:YD repeat-containing protein
MTNPLGQTTAMLYGSLSSLTSITDAYGNTTQYSYDSAGNLLSITYPDGTSAPSSLGIGVAPVLGRWETSDNKEVFREQEVCSPTFG